MDSDKTDAYLTKFVKILIITCMIKYVSSSDCSPSTGTIKSTCLASFINWTVVQTEEQEIHNILENSPALLKVTFQIDELKMESDLRFKYNTKNLTLGYGLEKQSDMV